MKRLSKRKGDFRPSTDHPFFQRTSSTLQTAFFQRRPQPASSVDSILESICQKRLKDQQASPGFSAQYQHKQCKEAYRQLAASASGFSDAVRKLAQNQPISQAEQYAFMKVAGSANFQLAKQEFGPGKLHPIRERIVQVALGEVGKVEAHTPAYDPASAPPNTRIPRKGNDRFYEYLQKIYPESVNTALKRRNTFDYTVKVGPKHGNFVPSWCGVFALWVHNASGNGPMNWTQWKLKQSSMPKDSGKKFDPLPQSEPPKPGDIAYQYIDKEAYKNKVAVVIARGGDPSKVKLIDYINNHHGIVVRSDPGSNMVSSVEGNIWAANSGTVLQNRKKSFWDKYYRARPKGE